MTTKFFVMMVTILTVLLSSPVSAQDSSEEFQVLRQQLQVLSKRLDTLEASNQALRDENARLQESNEETVAAVKLASEQTEAVARQVSDSGAASWTERIKLKGDFRFRYENIDEQAKIRRNRSRVRARAAILAKVTDDVEVGLGFATGGDDPVSTNQTLGGGGSTKGMNLDLAYFNWSGLENSNLIGGKFKNVLYKPGKNPLLWDGDWNPEGLAFAWANGDYFFNSMGTWLESDSKKESEFSYAVQAGFNRDLSGSVGLTAGISYTHFGTKGKGSFFGDDDDFFGNSFDPLTHTYLHDYDLLEVFADLGFELAGNKASVFVDYVQNQDASNLDTGFALGFKYGSAKARGTWQMGYTYQDLEADAALGLLVDSDFGGGGTDSKGHILKYGYAFEKNWNAGITYFINETGVGTGNRHDYDRLQADLVFKY